MDEGVLTAYPAAGENSEGGVDLSIIWPCGPPIRDENRVGPTVYYESGMDR